MKTLFIQLGLAASLLLTACDTMVTNVDPPQVEQELIVYSFISPDEPQITVEVRKTMPIFSGSFSGSDTISNATVWLKQGGNQIQLPYIGEGKYRILQSQFPLSAGLRYELEVTTPDGKQATAATTIPVERVNIDSFNLTQQAGPFGLTLDLLRVYWNDISSAKNYYQLYTTSESSNEDTLFGDPGKFVLDNQVLDDEFVQNNRITTSFQTSLGLAPGDTVGIEMILAHTDEAYYRYHLLRLNYSGSNPFSEPTVMFNNVNGGVGVFGSYRFTKRTFRITR